MKFWVQYGKPRKLIILKMKRPAEYGLNKSLKILPKSSLNNG
jgi:hypothetical protein